MSGITVFGEGDVFLVYWDQEFPTIAEPADRDLADYIMRNIGNYGCTYSEVIDMYGDVEGIRVTVPRFTMCNGSVRYTGLSSEFATMTSGMFCSKSSAISTIAIRIITSILNKYWNTDIVEDLMRLGIGFTEAKQFDEHKLFKLCGSRGYPGSMRDMRAIKARL